MVTYTFRPDILTYEPYRMVCDECEWVSTAHAQLSTLCREMTEHTETAHKPKPKHRPAPIRPVLHSVSTQQ